jgi:16S rRNA (guanine527-N7)-methyltransferase
MGNIWTNHILHSISPLFYVDIPLGAKVLDLGSGGGLPGIPLSIMRDDLKVTLLDSVAKKTSALEWIIAETALTNVDVVTARAEELAKKGINKFDIVIARAVSSLVDLVKWSRDLVARRDSHQLHSDKSSSGMQRRITLPCLLALKGGNLETEIEMAKRKTGEDEITTIDLVFFDRDDMRLKDKKLVIVQLKCL